MKPEVAQIRSLLPSDRHAAEKLATTVLMSAGLQVENLSLIHKPESLNSVCGTVAIAGQGEVFFKAHWEDGLAESEYNNHKLLSQAGYPMIEQLWPQISVETGISFYPAIKSPTFFDLIRQVEVAEYRAEKPDLGPLRSGIAKLGSTLTRLHRETFSDEAFPSPAVEQLFQHRLMPSGRIDLFYRDRRTTVGAEEISFEQICCKKWRINGTDYGSLGQAIDLARRVIGRSWAAPIVVGHGDLHLGNIFLEPSTGEVSIFDPTFAGRHHPLIDLVKPYFHSVFAEWMYFPDQVANRIVLNWRLQEDSIELEHDFLPSDIRLEMHRAMVQGPIDSAKQMLSKTKQLATDWEAIFRAYLMCCPLLTVNLFERKADGFRFPEAIRLLGLSMAVESYYSCAASSNKLANFIGAIS